MSNRQPLPAECPYRPIEDAVACGAASPRDLSPALHCALLSDCDHRIECLARVSDLIEEVKAGEEMAA